MSTPKDRRMAEEAADALDKETYFLPFAEQRGLAQEADGGRRVLAEQAAHRYKRIRQLCKEDILCLEQRIQEWVEE